MKSKEVKKAEKILKQGEPLPVDLFAALLEQGVDVNELERKVTRRKK